MKFLRLLFLLPALASAQTWYNQTDVISNNAIALTNKTLDCNSNTCLNIPSGSLPQPLLIGTSLTPVFLNSYNINGTFTANSTTFVCNTGCTSLQVGQSVGGSDGTNLLYPATVGELGAVITSVGTGINGATITTNIASNAALTPGTYTIPIGTNRWSTTSSALVNTLGTANIWSGQAAHGNTTWVQQYLASDCDDPAHTTNCSVMAVNNRTNNMVAARTSDANGGVEANISLAINDDTSTPKNLWNHYWQTELMAGAGTGKQTFGGEIDVFNFNSTVVRPNPYNFNIGAEIEDLRLATGQAGLGTMYNAADAIGIYPINSTSFEVGILFANGSINSTTMPVAPAISLPVNYGLTWYRTGQAYIAPTWQIFASDSTQNGNSLDLQATGAVVTIASGAGAPTDSLTAGGIAFAGNYRSATGFGTTGVGIDVGAQTIQDNIIANSGTVASTYVHHIGQPTLTTAGTGVTLTNAETLVIDNAPAAGTNVTITNPFALYVLSGKSRFDGALVAGNTFTVNSGTTIINSSGSATTSIGTTTNSGTVTIGNTSGPNIVNLQPGTLQMEGVLYVSSTAPTINSGFNTSGNSVTGNNTAAFQVTVGTSTGTSIGVLTMPTALTGWACSAADVTTPATHAIQQTGSSTTSVTVTDYSRTAGTAQNMANSDKIVFHCGAF